MKRLWLSNVCGPVLVLNQAKMICELGVGLEESRDTPRLEVD